MKSLRAAVKPRAPLPRLKKRLRAHAAFIYKFRGQSRSADAGLATRTRGAARFLLDRVALEAARSSKLNRRAVITQREIRTALRNLKPRGARPMDGA